MWDRVYSEKAPVMFKSPLILSSWGADKEGKEASIRSIDPFTRPRDSISNSETFPRVIDPVKLLEGETAGLAALPFLVWRLAWRPAT
jgi:hypothetical protein